MNREEIPSSDTFQISWLIPIQLRPALCTAPTGSHTLGLLSLFRRESEVAIFLITAPPILLPQPGFYSHDLSYSFNMDFYMEQAIQCRKFLIHSTEGGDGSN